MLYLIIIGCILAVFFVFLYILYFMAFQNSPARQKRRKSTLRIEYRPKITKLGSDLKNAPYEEKIIKNREGKRLCARYYHNRDNAPAAIIFHGYRSRAMSDCGGGYRIFCDLGFNILIPDQRAHGKSGARSITFGIKERFDCLDWIEYLNVEYDVPDIFIVGVSMGGATVLMAAGEKLPDNVRGVISDCSYSSPEGIIRKVIADMKLPQKLLFPFVRLAGRIYGGFDVCSFDPLRAVSQSELPVLLIHGEGDDFVPYTMAISAQRSCELLSIPDATHGMSYIYNTEKYTEAAVNFVEDCLKKG